MNDREPDQHRIFSIPPGAPFLDTLVEALLDGALIPGFAPRNDPLKLASATIYLPTRRAARALAAAFIDASGGKALILPSIRTLGDPDDDETPFLFGEVAEAGLPQMDPLGRKLHLAMLVRHWATSMAEATRQLFADEDIIIPTSAAEAISMAGDLGRLMDAMATEEIDWQALKAIGGGGERPERWAEWWNLTLHFLSIATSSWPQFLAATGQADPVAERQRLLDLRTRRLLENGSPGPVIAAGSTGSIPATARFLAAIARQTNGAVVIPGLDISMPQDIQARLVPAKGSAPELTAPGHPQYGMLMLLKAMQLSVKDVAELGRDRHPARTTILRVAMLPGAETGRWQGFCAPPDGLAGIALVEAGNERLEALAAAIALREALETPDKTAALVTPDRNLARRVAAELVRFGIAIDDSAGQPLAHSPAGRLARTAIACASSAADPVLLASLLKEPAVSGGSLTREARIARLYELAVLRDCIDPPTPGQLAEAATLAREIQEQNPFPVHEVAAMLPQDWEAVIALGGRIDTAFAPLNRLVAADDGATVAQMMSALSEVVEALVTGEAASRLAASPDGMALRAMFDRAGALGDAEMAVAVQEFPAAFDAVIGEETWRDNRRHHPRLAILGPLEARLQRFDRMVLCGLNEGTWPGAARNDPFLNRPMKAGIGLSTPERRIGQAAHDFQQLCGSGEVILTRSLRSSGAPTVAARWVQRLQVLTGNLSNVMIEAGRRYLALAQAVDRSTGKPARIERPNPKPPLALRPTSLSVTDVERWIRDPYAIYARHILKLSPLPPLERVADPGLRGRIQHKILARFVVETGDEAPQMQRFSAIAQEEFGEAGIPDEVSALWIRRFESVGASFVDWEASRRPIMHQAHCEVSGKLVVEGTGFTLRGRADRIDRLEDGTFSIIDYKSGSNPSTKQARSLSPQLALEAAMAARGAFAIGAPAAASELLYVRLRPGDAFKIDAVHSAEQPADALAEESHRRLVELIQQYGLETQGYVSKYAPMKEADFSGEYDHLARVREWATEGSEGEDE